jgi:outer membrane receptor for ferrienterochelin and colicin
VETDILQKIPQVSVDADGTVELAGSSSIRFLIDGKPSTVFGSNITDVLQSIPASQIKSVEVVTNPGAKYDASGLGGIINIILKKSNQQGVNGNLSATIGTRVENGSFNFNARKNNFGFNSFISGNERLEAYTPNKYERVSYDNSSNTIDHLFQDGGTNYERHGIQSGIGFDWTIHQKNFLSGSLNYNVFGKSANGGTNQLQTTLLNVIDSAANLYSFNYRFNLNATYAFTKSFSVEFFGDFNSPRHEAQGTYPSFTSYTFALRKQFWKGKGSIAVTSTNLFNEYLNRKTTLSGPGFSIVNTQLIPYQTSGINFTWKFGKLEFKKVKEPFDTNLNPPSIE